jgi:hypothetical protein
MGSLATGTAALVGLAMFAYGVLALALGGTSFTTHDVPNGPVAPGHIALGLEGNGWTNLLWLGAGALLVMGSPRRGPARVAGLAVALALASAAFIALLTRLLDGNWGIFGVLAGNAWTVVAWSTVAFALALVALTSPGARKADEPRAAGFSGSRPSRTGAVR